MERLLDFTFDEIPFFIQIYVRKPPLDARDWIFIEPLAQFVAAANTYIQVHA